MRDITTLCIHHSASPSGNVVEFRKEHIARGWADIGYHNVITNGHGGPDGVIEAGRPHTEVGAAVFGANTGKLHVCLVGNFHPEDPGYTGLPTVRQMYALGRWLLVNGYRYGTRFGRKELIVTDHRHAAIEGHGTACPGDKFPTPWVREWYNLHIGAMHDGAVIPDLAEFLRDKGYWSALARPYRFPAFAKGPVKP